MDRNTDPRIRLVSSSGEYRVVAPHARDSGGSVYINGELVVERATHDGLGQKAWLRVATIPQPMATKPTIVEYAAGVDESNFNRALHALLGGGC